MLFCIFLENVPLLIVLRSFSESISIQVTRPGWEMDNVGPKLKHCLLLPLCLSIPGMLQNTSYSLLCRRSVMNQIHLLCSRHTVQKIVHRDIHTHSWLRLFVHLYIFFCNCRLDTCPFINQCIIYEKTVIFYVNLHEYEL